MKGKFITVLNNNQVPEHLRNEQSFQDVFPTEDGGSIDVIIEHSTEFNEDGEFVVYAFVGEQATIE